MKKILALVSALVVLVLISGCSRDKVNYISIDEIKNAIAVCDDHFGPRHLVIVAGTIIEREYISKVVCDDGTKFIINTEKARNFKR